MCELVQHIVLEQIPRITGISSPAMLGNMDPHRREVRSVKDIMDIRRPILVADAGRTIATNVDILEIRTMFEGPFHQVDATGNDDRMQFAIILESVESDLVHLITKSIVGHLAWYLHDILRIVSWSNRSLATTP